MDRRKFLSTTLVTAMTAVAPNLASSHPALVGEIPDIDFLKETLAGTIRTKKSIAEFYQQGMVSTGAYSTAMTSLDDSIKTQESVIKLMEDALVVYRV